MLAHIPFVERQENFLVFSEGGKRLAESHYNYAACEPDTRVAVTGAENRNYLQEKMPCGGIAKEKGKSVILYNADVIFSNIPLVTHDYLVNGRSVIEWIMESCRVNTDRESCIANNPNT